MPRIAVHCDCGRRLTVRAERAGGRFRCPSCGTLLTVPDFVAKEVADALAAVDDGAEARVGSTCGICQTQVQEDERSVGCSAYRCAAPRTPSG